MGAIERGIAARAARVQILGGIVPARRDSPRPVANQQRSRQTEGMSEAASHQITLPPNTPELRPLLIGTAGHIDHGKTSLVLRLTGVNTDRLPEEKARGISIDLGFAHFDCGPFRFGVVDVPGHERFVRQMVAGAANIDLAIFVVAADDGVMPQTREHLDILQLLGVKHGVIAVTRRDLVDDEMLQLVAEEIRELVADTFLRDSPIVAVSSITGDGFEQLKSTLVTVASSIPDRTVGSVFRLPIDRVFTLPGRGTIVTGSVLTGQVAAGDELELLPQQRRVRVRSVQHHGASVDHADAHRRAAINLAGVSLEEVHRGHELATPGMMIPTTRFLAEIECLAHSSRALRHRQVLTLHAGTSAVTARLRLAETGVAPGSRAFADIRLREPLALEWGQRFILRTSSSTTIGGGRVIDPLPGTRRVRDLNVRCQAAASEDPAERLGGLLQHQPSVTIQESGQRLGMGAAEYHRLLNDDRNPSSIALKEIRRDSHTGEWIHDRWLQKLSRSIIRVLRLELLRHSPKRMLPRALVVSLCRGFDGSQHVPFAIDRLLKSGDLVQRADLIGPADQQVSLTKRQREVLDLLLPIIAQNARTPPTHKELCATTDRLSASDIVPLLKLCHEDGTLIAVSPDLSYSPDGLESLRQGLIALFGEQPQATLSEIRDALQMTRKHVVPLAEYWDREQITIRHGDLRFPGPRLTKSNAQP